MPEEMAPIVGKFFLKCIDFIHYCISRDEPEPFEVLVKLFTPSMQFYLKYDNVEEEGVDYEVYNSDTNKTEIELSSEYVYSVRDIPSYSFLPFIPEHRCVRVFTRKYKILCKIWRNELLAEAIRRRQYTHSP
jgi:hypothetical protein